LLGWRRNLENVKGKRGFWVPAWVGEMKIGGGSVANALSCTRNAL